MSTSRRLSDAVAHIKELDSLANAQGGDDGRNYICHSCGKEDLEYPMPWQCARCKMTWYCSNACMSKAFAEHSKLCSKVMEMDVSAHTKTKLFDMLPDGRKLSELLQIRSRKKMWQPLSIEELEVEPGIYRIPEMADEGKSTVQVSVVDERGYKFKPIRAGMLFRFKESGQRGASWVEKNESSRLGDVYYFYGNGGLKIIFTSSKGIQQTIDLKAKVRIPGPPTLKIEDLGGGIMKVVTSDDCIRVKCQDEEGNRFKKALTSETLFRYQKASKLPKVKTRTEELGTVKLIKGFGDLKISASETTGLTSTVIVAPTINEMG